jgi:putative ABC transport system permease protein
MGIRMAVGALPREVMGLILGQGLMLALFGVAIGVAGALAMSRILSSMLFGTRAADPVTYAMVAAVFVGIALAASYFPARRAARRDPVRALRSE